jgi:phosphopantetheinyl transferase (holo-ACP synthase)
VLWRDLEVLRRGGPPQLLLHGGAARRLGEIGGRSALLTLTHARDLAIAHVMLLGGDPVAR